MTRLAAVWQHMQREGGGSRRFPVAGGLVEALAEANRPGTAGEQKLAAQLYLSIYTVDAHLSHIYVKLGIRSRGSSRAPA
jgi:hypothetical protein